MPKNVGTEMVRKPLSKSGLYKKSLCDYVINVASGCLHGCTFCYVPSTPVIRMRGRELAAKGVEDAQMDWGQYLLTRTGSQGEPLWEALDQQLAGMRTWTTTPAGRGVILLCSGTDPYQNARTAAITRRCVEVALAHGKRVRILTRGLLWTRDLDILVHPDVTVGMSLPHFSDRLSRQVEPYAPRPSDRLKALQKGKEAGCRIYVAMAPTPPMMSYLDIRTHLWRLKQLQPEVIFWEPINSRGSNGDRMAQAGIDWGKAPNQDWVRRCLEQWQQVQAAAAEEGIPHLMHYWPDKSWRSQCENENLIHEWWERPTVERWEAAPCPAL